MFTEMEIALMEGGHSLEPKKGLMGFIKEIHEARLIRTREELRYNYKEICEYTFLVLLAIEFLSRIKEGRNFAEQYSRLTASYINYTEFRTSATDLYNFIYFIQADPDEVEKIFKSTESKEQRQRTQLPRMELNRWLMQVANKQSKDLYFFMRLEQALNVQNSDIKDIRRMLAYNNPSRSDLQLIASKILVVLRNKLPTLDARFEMEQILSGGKYTYIK